MNRRLAFIFIALMASLTVSAQNRFEIGVNYSPTNLSIVDDAADMLFKTGLYAEYRLALSRHFDLGARLDYKLGPVKGVINYDDPFSHSAALSAVADFNLLPGKVINPFIGLSFGPGFGMHNDTLDHLWYGQFLVFWTARAGIDLFNHLRISADLNVPYFGGQFPPVFITANVNIGWIF